MKLGELSLQVLYEEQRPRTADINLKCGVVQQMTSPEVLSLCSGSTLCPGQMGQEGDGQPGVHVRRERVGVWVGGN